MAQATATTDKEKDKAETIRATALLAKAAGGKLARLGPERRSMLLRALAVRKASLLPIGVVAVEGQFDKGDVVEIRDGSGRVHGRGLVNYPAEACRVLAGRQSDDIEALLGWRGYDALVTRDNLVMGAL